MARASVGRGGFVLRLDHHHVLGRDQVEGAGQQAAVAERVAAEVGGEGLRDGHGAVEVGLLAGQQVQGRPGWRS